MPLRPPAGFIRLDYNPLKTPDSPTSPTASASDSEVTVSFTAPSNVGGGAITLYGVVAKDSSNGTTISATGASSPVTVTGLTNGTTYTAAVWAVNSFGPGPFSSFTGSFSPAATRGVFGGGNSSGGGTNIIDYVTISTNGNATDFGDLPVNRANLSACSSSTRGLFGGGGSTNAITFITIASTGNASTFGNLIESYVTNRPASFSNSTRGIWAGGYDPFTLGTRLNTIQYVTIATAGNATDFGDISISGTADENKIDLTAGCASSTRGIIAGGQSDGGVSSRTAISYITIATTGNSTSFGSLTQGTYNHTSAASSTRGLFIGGFATDGSGAMNVISYITIASTGGATDFGDLTVKRYSNASCSSKTVAVCAGGTDDIVSHYNVIDKVTIATTGNASDFGDLTVARVALASCSNGHGGL